MNDATPLQHLRWCQMPHGPNTNPHRHGLAEPIESAEHVVGLSDRLGSASVTVEAYDEVEDTADLDYVLCLPHVVLKLTTDEWGRAYFSPRSALRLAKLLIDGADYAYQVTR